MTNLELKMKLRELEATREGGGCEVGGGGCVSTGLALAAKVAALGKGLR